MQRMVPIAMLTLAALAGSNALAQTVQYKCDKCGRYHVRSVAAPAYQVVSSNATQTASEGAVVVASASVPTNNSVQPASAVQTLPQATVVPSGQVTSNRRWRFDKANNWARRIDPRAQAWAQEEANRLARRGYQGYLQNGHPGGNNPYASVTGTGTTFPGADLIHTCEGSPGMTLVAEAAAVSHDGRIYGVRSWR